MKEPTTHPTFLRLPINSLSGDHMFRRVHGKGKLGRAGLVNLRWLAQRQNMVTVGIVVSKKVGNAVIRNRLRRQIREIVRRMDWPPALIMIVLQPTAAGKPFNELLRAVAMAAQNAGLGVAPLHAVNLPDKMAEL